MNLIQLDEEAVFQVARKIADRVARRVYLDQVCTDDRGLRDRLEALLGVYEQEQSFLNSPPLAETLPETLAEPPLTESSGTVIGPYKLLEPIGEGGMGVVYMAEQTKPVRRKVALKIIKPGMDTRQVIARFEAERQALALMDHPNIAKVHDGGTTESGHPYFVMELVRGIPITEFCDRDRLSIRDRLELFVLVCRAVQHAHQKGIIHRDLKPSNILITLHDGVPVPKIIDFGIVKATSQTLTDKTLYTGFAQLIGTPLYMSPEQAQLSGLDIDTRSDIYSLGVLLYELLTGTTPYDGETFRTAGFDEIRRIIREHEPPRPSTRLSVLTATITTVSANRGSEPRHLNRTVRGDLDWIVMKALEKDRRRRYETASDFAADVMRYLTNQPVEACPPSTWYRFTKYVRRHRTALTTAALVTTALVAGTAISVWQAVRATWAERQAMATLEESELVLEYLVKDVFGAAAPEKARGRTLTVHDLLTIGEKAIPARFGHRPSVEATAREALGRAYADLGRYDEAEQQFRRVAALRTQVLGPDHPDTLAAQTLRVHALCPPAVALRSRVDEAEPIARQVLEARTRVLGPIHLQTLASMTALAWVLTVKESQILNKEARGYPSGMVPDQVMRARHSASLDQARRLVEAAHAGQTRLLGPTHPETLSTLDTLGCVLLFKGDFAGAETVLRRASEAWRRTLGPEHPASLQSLKYLGYALRRLGRTDEATRIYVEVTEGHRQTFGATHIQTSSPLSALFGAYRKTRDAVAIRDLCEDWLRDILATPVDPDPYQSDRRGITLEKMALELVTLPAPIPFDAALAVRAAEEAVAIEGTSYSWTVLGAVYWRTGRHDEALRALRTSAERPGWKGGGAFYWFTMAQYHSRRGEPAQALDCYERGLADKDEIWFDILDHLRDEASALLNVQPPQDKR